MGLCKSFIDPSEARCCAAGVQYQAVTGGGQFYMALRLPCYDLTNRQGQEKMSCAKYQPQEQEHDQY